MLLSFIPQVVLLHLLKDITTLLGILIWPLVVIIIFLILRKPLKDFINRIKSIGFKGTGIETEIPKKQSSDEGSPFEKLIKEIPNKNLERIQSNFNPETLEVFRKAVLNESNVDSFKTHEEREKVLFSYSQMIYLIMQFNRIYTLIYGSQIRILERLNSSKNETLDSIMPFFDEAKRNDPKFYENYPFKNYLEFLTSYGLIQIEANSVIITPIGRDFFKYIVESGFSLNRVF